MDQENQKNQETQERKIRTADAANGIKPDTESQSKPRLANQRILLVKAEREDIPVLAGFLGDLFSLEEDFEADIEKQSRGLMLALDNPN
jgi:hypothetical protein